MSELTYHLEAVNQLVKSAESTIRKLAQEKAEISAKLEELEWIVQSAPPEIIDPLRAKYNELLTDPKFLKWKEGNTRFIKRWKELGL